MEIALGLGRSLWPFIRSQSILQYEAAAPAGIRLGDLIIFCGKKKSVCHRVLLKRKNKKNFWFFVKGDGNIHSDGWIPDYRLMGKVTHVDGNSVYRHRQYFYALILLLYSRIVLGYNKLRHV